MNIKTRTSISQMIVKKLKDANLIFKKKAGGKTIFFSNTYNFGRPKQHWFQKLFPLRARTFFSQQLIWKIGKNETVPVAMTKKGGCWTWSLCKGLRDLSFWKKFSFQGLLAKKAIKKLFIGTEINCLID